LFTDGGVVDGPHEDGLARLQRPLAPPHLTWPPRVLADLPRMRCARPWGPTRGALPVRASSRARRPRWRLSMGVSSRAPAGWRCSCAYLRRATCCGCRGLVVVVAVDREVLSVFGCTAQRRGTWRESVGPATPCFRVVSRGTSHGGAGGGGFTGHLRASYSSTK
jgi:hypothetical protein